MENSLNYTTDGDVVLQDRVILGLRYNDTCKPAILGNKSVIRAGTIIYGDVEVGEGFQTGHNVMIREKTRIGNHVVVGTNSIIDGNVTIGNLVKIESSCYIPTHVTIGSKVFIGPGVVLTNDRYPLKLRDEYRPEGPTLEDGVTIGGGVTICPGVTIGSNSFVAAGATVVRDVPPNSLVVGCPGIIKPLPEYLKEENMALSWRNL